MSTITDNSSLFLVATFKTWHATYSGSQGNSTFLDPAPTYAPVAQFLGMDSTTELTTGFNTYYKLMGYNPVTKTYENWHCKNTPQFSPPSGNVLLDIHIVSSWIDR